MKDPFQLKGKITIRVYDKEGRIKDVTRFDNLVVNVGKAEVAKLIGSGLGGTAFGYIAIGTGTTAEAVTDTAMEVEVSRKAATVTSATTNVTNDTAHFEATFSSADGLTGSHAITEYGLFNDPTAGTMLSHKIDAEKNMNWDNGDQLSVSWDIYVQ